MSNEQEFKEVQVHIKIGCADARDLSRAYLDSKKEVVEEYATRGIRIEIEMINSAGSFVTPGVIEEVKALLRRRSTKYGDAVSFFIHVNTHGDGELESGVGKAFEPSDFYIVKTATYNCGMLKADDLAEEMNEMLRREGLRIDGVRGILDLRFHAQEQMRIIKEAVDGFLRWLSPVTFTAGVQDYADSQYFRVDGQRDVLTILDEIYIRAQRKLESPEYAEERDARIARQMPSIGLIHMGQIENAREIAIKIAVNELGIPIDLGENGFRAGLVFGIGSVSMNIFEPFDPYQVASFVYAAQHLRAPNSKSNGLKDWIALGRTQEETGQIVRRITRDPVMDFFVRHLGATVHTPDLGTYQSIDRREKQNLMTRIGVDRRPVLMRNRLA